MTNSTAKYLIFLEVYVEQTAGLLPSTLCPDCNLTWHRFQSYDGYYYMQPLHTIEVYVSLAMNAWLAKQYGVTTELNRRAYIARAFAAYGI